MHPALSIIAFTTASGLGYGLAAVLGLGVLDPSAVATKLGHVAALVLIAGGLLSSTLHLGNPQRAWRALSQWRSSWLSREGVMAIVTFLPLCASAYLSIFENRFILPLGIVGAVLCFVTVFCTSMIYASLRSVQAWHTQLTPLCYVLFALSSGLAAAAVLAYGGAAQGSALAWSALAAQVAAWSAKWIWRRRMMSEAPISTPESATGLGTLGRLRMSEPPHTMDNYLTREMGFRVARKHAAKLAVIAFVAGGKAPAILLLLLALLAGGPGAGAAVLASLALVLHMLGLLVERWLFFAEARHAVMNFYGRRPEPVS